MTSNKETRSIRLAPAVITKMITGQADSLAKAVAEALMNAIDAMASQVHVTLDAHQLIIEDDGMGFRSREEVEHWFGVLGGSSGMKGHRLYGEHGMGRATLWAYSRTTWYTNEFVLKVDVPKSGLAYEVDTVADNRKGTKIVATLFNSLAPVALQEVLDQIEKLCALMPGNVFLNTKLVSSDPSARAWTSETPRYWLQRNSTKRQSQLLELYNQGVFVGLVVGRVGGTLCTKPGHALSLNISRNQVLDTCALWKSIRAEIGFDPVVQLPGEIAIGEQRVQAIRGARQLHSALTNSYRPSNVAWNALAFEDIDGATYTPAQILQQTVPVIMRQVKGTEIDVCRTLHRDGRAIVLNNEVLHNAVFAKPAQVVADLRSRAAQDAIPVTTIFVLGSLEATFPDLACEVKEVKLSAAHASSFAALVDGIRLVVSALPSELQPAFRRLSLKSGGLTCLARATSADVVFVDAKRLSSAFTAPLSLFGAFSEIIDAWLERVQPGDESVAREVELSAALTDAVAFALLRRVEIGREKGSPAPTRALEFVADLVGS